MITCPYCNNENKDTARYCRSCGKLLPGASFAENPEIDSLVDKIEELQNDSKHFQEKINESKQKIEQQDVNRRKLESRILKLNSTITENDKAILKSQTEIKRLEEIIKDLESKTSGKIWLWFAIIILSISCLVMCAGNSGDNVQPSQIGNSDIEAYEDTIKNITEAYKSALSELREVYSDAMPIVIKDITVVGAEGETEIQSEKSTYLYTKIKAYSVIEGNTKFYIKYTDPSGYVSTGDTSPQGYSTDFDVELKPFEMTEYTSYGWGNETKGHWSPGNYKVEIFFKNKCIGSKNFIIL